MLSKKIYFSSSDKGGCCYYRVKGPAEYLKQEWQEYFPLVKDVNEIRIEDPVVLASDIIVIQRHSNPVLIEPLKKIKEGGKKLVYEIDDNLWEIPATNVASHAYSNATVKNVNTLIKVSDAVVVSTEPLKEYIIQKGLHENVYVVPNMLSTVPDFVLEHGNSKVRIGWAGSTTHSHDFSWELCKALRRIGSRQDVELVFMGWNPVNGFNCEFHKFCKAENYYEYFANLKLDIAIAPIEKREFNRCKSNVKFLEYSILSVPTIASSVYPYSETIFDGQTGLLVRNEKDWIKHLEYLVDNPLQRKVLSENAYHYVKENFTFEHNGGLIQDKWEEIIKDLYK